MRPTYIASCVLLLTHVAVAQPPSPPNRNGGGRGEGAAPTAEAFIQKLMSLDANQDGKLTREEVTDVRLHPLLARADANQDGSVTQEELKELHAKESATLGSGRGGPGGLGGGPGGGGPGGQGGPNGAGGGRGMRGGMGGGPGGMSGGPPKPGEVLPSFLQEELQLTERQKTQLSALQKDVDARLAKILTAEQKEQLTRMRDRGPGGGPGGPGGPGGGGRGPGDNGDGPPGPPPGGNEEARGRRPPSE